MFSLGKITHFEVSEEFVLLLFSGIFRSKNHPKTFENDVPTLPKSTLKMHWFSTSLFSGPGLDFGASWASNLEPSWAFWPQKIAVAALFNLLKLKVL